MTRYRRSALARLALLLVVLTLIGTACSLSGGGDKKGSESQPTIPATITPPLTRTPIPTFTAFPTLTPFQGGGFQPIPTATRIALNSTAIYYTPFPTWTPAGATATPYPYDVRISYPVDGSTIAGYVTIIGSASHPRFLQYALEWGPDPNPGNLWYPITSPITRPVINGALGAVNTTQARDGIYQIRLHLWLNDGTETFDVATGIKISNTAPTAVPTLTPTPRPNRSPVISPIPSQEVNAGSTITLPVTASDPDGDAVNLFVASSNNAIATSVVTSKTSINVTGVTAGVATIAVTANDNRGGLTTTAFIVTVKGQNHAPTISPILGQALAVGDTLNVAIAVSDVDADPLTVTATSDNTGIVTVAVPNTSTVSLTGIAVGSANVTVTANDNKGGVINTTFRVDVGEPNRPPTVDTIPAQTLIVGDALDVTYIANDPDGDAITADAGSDTPGVVTATITAPGTIHLVAASAGPATVSLSVSDGEHVTIATFPVTVVMGNVAPTIDPIAPQTMSVGETKGVAYTVTDPENDPLNQQVSSDNPGVVTAAINVSGTITLNATSAGTATVMLTVDDGNNPAVSMPVTVSVAALNLPPAIETIFPQTLNLGGTLNVGYTATDPDNDTLTADVSSDNQGIVTASISAPGTITLTGVGAGNATVTLAVSDGNNPAVSMPFAVSVIQPNSAPGIDPIEPQALNVGAAVNVGYNAFDPDGDPLTADVGSDNTGVVTAVVSAPGTITLTGVGVGNATVTLTVNDGINAPVSMPFAVSIAMVNNNPTIQPINPQSVNVGAPLSVSIQAFDPDGDPLTLLAVSDNPGVATAVGNGPAEVIVTGVNPGAANVMVDVDDGRGGVASTNFQVTVVGVNNPPVIQPIGNQSLTAGEQISVPVNVSDADGDPVTLTALSQNMGVVVAESFGTDTIVLTGAAEGVTVVDVTADDARGGVTMVSFNVTVSSPAPTFDLMAYPVLPDISPAMAQSMRQLYQSAVVNYGTQGGAFSKVGGAGVSNQNFMVPFATSGQYDLGNYGYLQGTVDFYSVTPVRPSVDLAINSFTVDSTAASEAEFNADQLMAQVVIDPICQGVGGSPLACEFNLTKPAIALISFDASNVIYMDPSVFRSSLQSLVSTALTQHGVIPVLATIPATDSVSTEQLTEYNRAIVEVATQFGGTGLPLWNLWRAMQERGITNPYGVAPEGPGNLTEGALSYGYNMRNLTALQVLDTVRQAANIN